MAIELKRAGRYDFVVLEKAEEVGGTWWENTYPGCGCDIRSLLYSYSFEPKHDWSRMFAGQGEILDYLKGCADRYELWPYIRFGVEVTGVEFDDATESWQVFTADGETYPARAVVAGMGPLHQPRYPEIPGLERFRGTTFHSAQWDHGYDLAGKRVVVIGTGASAIQFVPRIADRVDHLTVFQRTPPWIVPQPDRRLSAAEHRLFRRFPSLQRAYRHLIYWEQEAMGLGFTRPRLIRSAQALARRHIRRQIPDPELRRKLTPDYTLGCKRVLVSSDYYPALTRPDVDLVTEPIAEVREHAVVTRDGTEYPVDAIIFGTGFHVTDKFDSAHIVGRNGYKIQDAWRDGMEAYLGVAVAGFPNLFLLLGPNSGLGHNSMVFMIEAQTRYILQCLETLDRSGGRSIEVRPDVQSTFNRRIQGRLKSAVWSAGGCVSWYLDENGVNRTIWPGSTVGYWLRTRRLRRGDYTYSHRP
ncbi:MAG: SidA/IucD/PvdA family monooxygenase [Streptosporangiales bacterium]|nr:SidA/IucD/PvdA family monooxygenase [Streptosporangiales bacterium]